MKNTLLIFTCLLILSSCGSSDISSTSDTKSKVTKVKDNTRRFELEIRARDSDGYTEEDELYCDSFQMHSQNTIDVYIDGQKMRIKADRILPKSNLNFKTVPPEQRTIKVVEQYFVFDNDTILTQKDTVK